MVPGILSLKKTLQELKDVQYSSMTYRENKIQILGRNLSTS